MKRRTFVLSLTMLAALCAAATAQSPATAFVGVTNAGGDPRYDYLSGTLYGIVAYDLSSQLSLVDRRNLEAVIAEQELSVSGIAASGDEAAKVGKLVEADWIVTGDFVVLGTDVLFTLSAVDVATSKTSVFRERGSDENVAHRACEQLVRKLTGKTVKLADETARRSILSLRDETPGAIALFSPIIDAEIFLDGSFAGYTTGDAKTPFELPNLSPGKHRVRVHLTNQFGVVKLPEIAFADWEAEIDVPAGKRVVVRDGTKHLSGALWELIVLAQADLTAPLDDVKKLALVKDLSFIDRNGTKLPVIMTLAPERTAKGLKLVGTLKAGSESKNVELALAVGGDDVEGTTTCGIVKLDLDLSYSEGAKTWHVDYYVQRTDVTQDEWMKR